VGYPDLGITGKWVRHPDEGRRKKCMKILYTKVKQPVTVPTFPEAGWIKESADTEIVKQAIHSGNYTRIMSISRLRKVGESYELVKVELHKISEEAQIFTSDLWK
jgi:hypothetical protein